MTDKYQNIDINEILEPIDIDLDKLFSLSYTFDNLKSFMKHIIKNQQTIADKINELERKASQQKEDNKKYQMFQNNIDRRLKSIEIGTSKAKKEMLNIKSKHDEGSKKNLTEKKDVTDGGKGEKKEGKEGDNLEENLDNKNIEEKKNIKEKIS